MNNFECSYTAQEEGGGLSWTARLLGSVNAQKSEVQSYGLFMYRLSQMFLLKNATGGIIMWVG